MKVLVCPLDWGLGHATRSIPLIRALLENGHQVAIGATGGGGQLLKTEFPQLTHLEFPGYKVVYARNPIFFLPSMLLQLPRLIQSYVEEKRFIQILWEKRHFEVVISDGRYGVYSKMCPSFFVSHQIFIRIPGHFPGIKFLEKGVLALNTVMLKNFSQIWIPDYAGPKNLSGQLSHGKSKIQNLVFISPLSRFEFEHVDNVEKRMLNESQFPVENSAHQAPMTYLPEIDCLAMVSGPEPLRSVFADLLKVELAQLPGTRILVLGLPDEKKIMAGEFKSGELNIFNHLPGVTLALLMAKARLVIARSGYTTVMELASLGAQAVLMVPTPGQSEQEYLAEHLEKTKTALCMHQSKFDLTHINKKITSYTGFKEAKKSMLEEQKNQSKKFSLVEFIRNHPAFIKSDAALKNHAQSVRSIVIIFTCLFLGAIKIEAAPKLAADAQKNRLDFFHSRLKSYLTILQKADSLKPYFLAYRVNDTSFHNFQANVGGVIRDQSGGSRFLNVEARVGNAKFDNTHPMRENMDFTNWGGYLNVLLPRENTQQLKAFEISEGILTEKILKTATDFSFRAAKDAYIKIRANVGVRPTESDTGLDFAPAPVVKHQDAPLPPMLTRKSLDSLYSRIQKASRLFANRPHLYASQIDCNYRRVQKIFVNSDGTAITHNETLGNIGIYVETKAEDGMILWLTKDFFFKEIPVNFPEDSLRNAVKMLLGRLDSLRSAPVMETFVGPVILENTAAAVFTHEVFGHRIEGHRQKAVDEGQTFVSKINQRLTASFITITDNPTVEYSGGTPLNGYYQFDDEGVAAERAMLMDKGIFKDFLFSRSVISPKGKSNGHGRGILGLSPTARMGNTILEASQTLSFAALKDSLRSLLKKTGKPFGLLLHDISGGFTYTGRDLPQSFRVEPLYVSQIFVDGRPDRLVRGVDAVGTPLVSLKQILAAGNDPGVFNGYCGAESGWVPVSAVAPSLLLESMEFESRAKDQNLPPLLSPPGVH